MRNNDLSADARQLFTEQYIDHPRAADTGFHQHHAGVITDDFSDNLGVAPERMFAHLPEDGRRGVRSYDAQQFPLVGHIKRIEPSNLTRALDSLSYRDLPFVDDHPEFTNEVQHFLYKVLQ
jgi:hypothetical protein